ncbi:MAG: ATP-binding cassette domain-containing protein [Candidatus Thermoplasmatota archaeon]|nr:ATP-binding cassette domain-containing protein [Candidatus Thermoplasmatota archaeon]
MLEVIDLDVRYENRARHAVSKVSFKIGKGEFVLLTGPSACGKSTLMQAVCGSIPWIVPAEVSGSITIDGTKYTDPAAIAGVACMVQQDPETQFCTETVEDEVAFGPENFRFPPARIRELVDKALLSVGASNLINRKLSTLSGGEKQKVAIASVLAVEPKLLILDEPTSNLDPRSAVAVAAAIDRLRQMKETTAILIDHRLRDFIHMATRVLVMESGSLKTNCVPGDCSFEELLKAGPMPIPPRSTEEHRDVLLSVQGLSYHLDGRTILDNVHLSVRKGDVVAIMGPNGSGKTTLLKHLIGLIEPQTGRIDVLGHSILPGRPVGPWILGRDIGLVFQNPDHQIFEDTIEREVRFASMNFQIPFEGADKAVAAFERSEGVFKHVHPHCLSFGQKRRLNVKSSASHGPKLLLMDEPFTGQDPENTRKLLEMISDMQGEGRTVVVVTHDVDFAKTFCTSAFMLSEGRVVASGSPETITDEHWALLTTGGNP